MYLQSPNRIVSFDHQPDDNELGTDVGFGLAGHSNIQIADDSKFFSAKPNLIPPSFVAAVMLATVLSMAVLILLTGNSRPEAWGIVILGAFISPVFYFGACWLNETTGSDPYLVYDKVTDQVTLPRHSVKFSKSQLREVIFLDRFVFQSKYCNGHQLWQVALLIEEGNGTWTYAHLYNTAGTGTGLQWSVFKDDFRKIADALGIKARCLSFTLEESKAVGDQARRLNQKPSTSLTASPSNVS